MYKKELEIIINNNIFRKREIFNNNLLDFASNDYLGLAEDKDQLKKAYELLSKYSSFAPKSSLLINGYHPLHLRLEDKLANINNFEKAIIVGSGFLANLALIETLTRKNSFLFIDEDYHASGILATKLIDKRFIYFKHNNSFDLEEKIRKYGKKRNLIAIEGIYSMSGELCHRDIFNIADKYKAILIIDEAHSSGVIGNNLLGILDYYNIKNRNNYIKMGTLGKAYGSYGAYILANKEIITFLENRAKPVIYSTSLSLFDTALALVNIEKIEKEKIEYIKKKINILELVKNILNIDIESPILMISYPSNLDVFNKFYQLKKLNFLVGFIRKPTVKKSILRVILRSSMKLKVIKNLLRLIL